MNKNKNTTYRNLFQEAFIDKDFLKEIVANFRQDLLEEEMQDYIETKKYQRTDKRSGIRNDYKLI